MFSNEERVGMGIPTVSSVRYDQIYSYDSSRVDIRKLFVPYENNRGGMLKQLEGHINGMVKSIGEGNFDRFPPIIVDINTLTIVDGNCRDTAAIKALQSGIVEKLVLRVMYIDVKPDELDKVVIDYNTTSKAWTTANFIYNFSKRGIESFTKLIEFCNESEYLHDKNGKIKPRYAVAILNKPIDDLKDTSMSITDEELEDGRKALAEAVEIKNFIEKHDHDNGASWFEYFLRGWAEFRRDYLADKGVEFERYFDTLKRHAKQSDIPVGSNKKVKWNGWFRELTSYL